MLCAGFTKVAPEDASSNILVSNDNLTISWGAVGGVSVDDNAQLGINVAYFISDLSLYNSLA
jgi:outer membrane protein